MPKYNSIKDVEKMIDEKLERRTKPVSGIERLRGIARRYRPGRRI